MVSYLTVCLSKKRTGIHWPGGNVVDADTTGLEFFADAASLLEMVVKCRRLTE